MIVLIFIFSFQKKQGVRRVLCVVSSCLLSPLDSVRQLPALTYPTAQMQLDFNSPVFSKYILIRPLTIQRSWVLF